MHIPGKARGLAASLVSGFLLVAMGSVSVASARNLAAGPAASMTQRAYPRGDDPLDHFTEAFAGGSDLSFSSLTWTPDGSAGFYRPCLEAASKFPVDPSGGAFLDVRDDGSLRVDLAHGRTVSFYGASTDAFYVGANGYITFGRPDRNYEATLEKHFQAPRISALFDDLDARAVLPGVTWKQLDDRVAVTWENVPEHGDLTETGNDFQVELFFDGRIRITWLDLDSSGSIVGLSRGAGLPPDFSPSDLGGYADCVSCAHGPLTEGEALSSECSPCAAEVCSRDVFCCGNEWDEFCVFSAICFCEETTTCGDGVTAEVCTSETRNHEACDDGNRVAGDGCDADCRAEACGDGVVQGAEECDDGNTAGGDGCDGECGLDAGTCRVVFGFRDSDISGSAVGALQFLVFQVGYPGVEGAFLGEGEAADCTPLLGPKLAEFEEDEPSRLLDVYLDLGDVHVYGPVDLLACLFRPVDPSYTPGAEQFSSAIQSIEFGGPVSSANPNVPTTSVACGAPAECGDGYVEGAESCDDANDVSGDGCEADCSVSPFDHHTMIFPPEGAFAFTRLTFFPDATPDGYRTCRTIEISDFPVDPSLGTAVTVGADEGVEIQLANDREVLLHGVSASRFFVRGDGSITFGGDGEGAPAGAEGLFSLPRVSVLFDGAGEVATSPNGQLRVVQLEDRVAVTWLDLVGPDGDTEDGNDFQVELFFDGRIRMSWLALPAGSGVVGLSRGEGLPPDFAESDFPAAPPCPSCSHEACTVGDPLVPQCSPCAAKVCALDSYCCDQKWDEVCLGIAIAQCGLACGCGDGALSDVAGEDCDDGNREDGDGCDEDCRDESCGDADKDPGGAEDCEDGNTSGGDGCSASCGIETGYCEMVLSLDHGDGPVLPVDVLEIDVSTASPVGGFVELDGGVSCLPEDPAWPALAQLASPSGELTLDLGPLPTPIYGPRDLWRCFFEPEDPASPPTIDDFDVESAGPEGADMSIRRLACTLPVCGDGFVQGDEACDEGIPVYVDGGRCSADCRLIGCGKPTDSSGTNPQARDALYVLRVAIGQRPCVPEVCDVDCSMSGARVTASDALRVLKKAVGQDIAMNCCA